MKKKLNKWILFAILAFFLGSLFPTAYSGVDAGLEQLKILVDVMGKIRDVYVEETDPKDLIQGALTGMASRLDEFSEYIPPADMSRMKEDTKGEFGGVGLRLSAPKEGELLVITPMPDTVSYKAGIEPGDMIVKIDNALVKDITNDKAVSMLRGKPGSTVKVTIERKNEKTDKIETKIFNLKREIIVPQVVFHRMLADNIGYILVMDFSGHTMEEFEKALAGLKKQGMQALILDFRFNPGGLLNAAVDMGKIFIGDNKLLVYTKGRKEEFFKEYRSVAKARYPDLPMILLVNQASASGSEIIAGAFQDHKRALLVGSRTFGKGSVQQVISLPDGSGLRLTVARYFTPNGRMIHKDFKQKDAKTRYESGGIVPDIEVPVDINAERRATVYFTNLIYSPSRKTAEPEGKEKVEDIALNRALEIMKARDVFAALINPEEK